ncbi:MAG: cbb3-type cytochrome c oxidase subunit I [Gammaproteobacteria bacterium]|nr:cbb3-type cytochrome c oxidase subunit I [Gammaproteobacteria bacterium]
MSEATSASRPETEIPAHNLIDTWLVYAHSIAALVCVLFAILCGIAISLQFFLPDVLGPWHSMAWGRMRYAHTQGIMLGWLGNAFLAFLYHAVPVLTGRRVYSPTLGRWIFGLWNFVVMLPGWLLVLSGVSQPIEWAEFPVVIDVFVILALVLAAVQFLPPFFKNGLEDLYVSSWYIIGALVFTLLAYPMGNIIPDLVPGAKSAAFTGLWIHDAVGLFVTPLALSILYFVIPAVTGRPIYSHFLSMLGFWGLFFLYPLNGTHHYVFSVIPMAAQLGAIAASALLGVIVIVVVTNLLMSLRGSNMLKKDIGLRFVLVATIFYLIVSVQGALQAQMSLNQVVHFTDWVIGHSHLAMLGFATFAGIGGIIHSWQRIPWARYNAGALLWSFWLLVIGISIMVIDLTIAGLVQAQLWQNGSPWYESVQQSRPYWMIRSLSAIPIVAGFILLFYGLCSGEKGAGVRLLSSQRSNEEAIAQASAMVNANQPPVSPAHFLRMSYRVAASAAIGFFILSVGLLGVWPGVELDRQIAAMSPPDLYALSDSEARGRKIYAREGCSYCHTQQIRYTEADISRFGAPTLAWEGQFDTPHMWGTRRVGPDLSRSSGTRNREWHLAHLYSPRSVVPWSIMPSYNAFFNGSVDQPRQEALDLVAYLESLGRARDLAWPDADERVRALYPEHKWAQMAVSSPLLNAHPGMARASGETPVLDSAALSESGETGEKLWLTLCAGCHGENGTGNGPAADWLRPRPVNLTQYDFTWQRLAQVLWHGVPGTAMPAWRDIPVAGLTALATYVKAFAVEESIAPPDQNQLAIGEQVYQNNCAQCHGDAGDGQGFAVSQLAIAPTDFTSQRPSLGESVRVLNNGIEGSSMAPWTDRLSESEILAVSYYLRQFYEAGP